MYIEPNTNIRILKNVPLDTTYNHTIYFSNKSKQTEYFSGLTKYNLTNQSYQRVKRGYMRIGIKAEDLYDCNYIMFQNTSFGTKWFYAFIKSVEYYSNDVSQIEFEIDVMQTWYFDYNIQECFVEREHVTSDKKWEHLVPEPFPLGETVYQKINTDLDLTPYYLLMSTVHPLMLSGDEPYAPFTVSKKINGNIYGYHIYLCYDHTELALTINDIQHLTDTGVIAIQTIPKFLAELLSTKPVSHSRYVTNEDFVTKKSVTIPLSHGNIDGHNPRNNKCFNYPYYSIFISNQQGLNDVLAIENFSDSGSFSYDIYGELTLGGSIILHPQNYKGLTGHDYDMILGSPPPVQFDNDFSNQFAIQQENARISGTLGAISSGVGAISSAAMGNVNGALNGLTGMVDSFANMEKNLSIIDMNIRNSIPSVHNLTGVSSFSYQLNLLNPIIAKRTMKKDLVQKLDDFFDVYGYQVNEVKKPNIGTRPYWNYVKTSGCVIKGSIPCDDMKSICNIYDKGITFWKNGADVGNYSLQNGISD